MINEQSIVGSIADQVYPQPGLTICDVSSICVFRLPCLALTHPGANLCLTLWLRTAQRLQVCLRYAQGKTSAEWLVVLPCDISDNELYCRRCYTQ